MQTDRGDPKRPTECSVEPARRADDGPPAASELPANLKVEELARLMRVDRKTLYEAIAAGEIPGVCRIGRVLRIHRDAVLEWMRSGRGPAGPRPRGADFRRYAGRRRP
jgi:excisionase family DNA binding protein